MSYRDRGPPPRARAFGQDEEDEPVYDERPPPPRRAVHYGFDDDAHYDQRPYPPRQRPGPSQYTYDDRPWDQESSRGPRYRDHDEHSDYGYDPRAARLPPAGRPPPGPPPRAPPTDAQPSKSPSPDPELKAFLEAQKKNEAKRMTEDEKKAVFSAGVARKSKFQKEKEELERKKKIEQEEAAAVFKDFVEAMNNEPRRASSSKSGRNFVASGGSSYKPARGEEDIRSGPKSMRAATTPARLFERPDESGPRESVPGKKRSAMADFASQLKEQQEAREQQYKDVIKPGQSISAILASEGQRSGSRNMLTDATTTNLCVLNLPAGVSERAFGEFFAQWGDVASVKIMWPRGDDADGVASAIRTTRTEGMTGFVSFMTRDDAEAAAKEAESCNWNGSVLRTSWGKPMPLPPRAAFMQKKKVGKRRRSPSPRAEGERSKSRSPPLPSRRTGGPRSPAPRSLLLRQVDPESEQALFVSTVANRVRQLGPRFEEMIREKEKDNPQFAFLQDEHSLLHQYFRSLLDREYQPLLPSAPFADDGLKELLSSDSEEGVEADQIRRSGRKERIGHIAKRRFEAMLRGMTPRRERIAKAMKFAIEHSHASQPVTSLLVQSLTIHSTPVPRKMARLYVVSDILSNSAAPVPNAWTYRKHLEEHLPALFDHLGDVARSFPGRMKQEGFKRQVTAVLDTWESWLLFPSASLQDLRLRLDKGTASGDSQSAEREHESLQQQDAEEDDLDGVPIDEETHAPPDLSGEQAGLDEEEDMDGVALD